MLWDLLIRPRLGTCKPPVIFYSSLLHIAHNHTQIIPSLLFAIRVPYDPKNPYAEHAQILPYRIPFITITLVQKESVLDCDQIHDLQRSITETPAISFTNTQQSDSPPPILDEISNVGKTCRDAHGLASRRWKVNLFYTVQPPNDVNKRPERPDHPPASCLVCSS